MKISKCKPINISVSKHGSLWNVDCIYYRNSCCFNDRKYMQNYLGNSRNENSFLLRRGHFHWARDFSFDRISFSLIKTQSNTLSQHVEGLLLLKTSSLLISWGQHDCPRRQIASQITYLFNNYNMNVHVPTNICYNSTRSYTCTILQKAIGGNLSIIV